MPTRVSSIESHPQRQEIIRALSSGQAYRLIESWTDPPVTIGTLSRFKRHSLDKLLASVADAKCAIANNGAELGKTGIESVTRAALTMACDPFLSRVAFLDTDRARVKALAEAGDNLSTWAALDRNDLSALELHARLAGRLDAPSQGSSTTFVLMPLMQVSTPEPRQVDAADVVFSDVDATDVPK